VTLSLTGVGSSLDRVDAPSVVEALKIIQTGYFVAWRSAAGIEINDCLNM